MCNSTIRRPPSAREIQHALLTVSRKLQEKYGVPISSAIGAGECSNLETLVPARRAAEYLGVSQKTLANWRCSGTRGLQYVQVGSRILYRQRDLDDFILNSRKSSTSEKVGGGAARSFPSDTGGR
ncbi:helix-turn-helix domain-containing protein [Rhizobium leguminosarum]|uniref:helix-turn-helix domain-containing protein n=1 Tax=Rhizobium leguminosarum TaxID=384 RepID=UPI003F983B71